MTKPAITGEAYWTHDPSTGAWYIGLEERRPAPYTRQVTVEAVLDIADDGSLAGIEIVDPAAPGPPGDEDD